MGSTNHTSNYELSQFLGSDKPAWLLDYNGDMQKIDTQMKANADAASAAQSKADTADGKADGLRTDLTTLNNQINDPTGLAADVATLAGTMNTVTSLIGNGEPTTTDKTLIGAINELDADKGDMSQLETTSKNTIVAAINELLTPSESELDVGTYRVTYNPRVVKVGAVKALYISALDNIVQGSNVIGTLPEALRPSRAYGFSFDFGNKLYKLAIDTAGNVEIYAYDATPNLGNWYITFTYI